MEASWSRGSDDAQALKTASLTCLECGEIATGHATGWRAYLTVDDHCLIYCATCAEREFGEDEAPSR